MTEKKTTKKESNAGVKLGLAATLVGAIATGYFLYGPKGKENRVKIKAWTLKAKAEVLEQFEKKKEITEEQYKEIVDKVTTKYGKLKAIGEEESSKLNRELKRHWKAIHQGVKDTPEKKKK